jgi:hypothetical protein
VVYIGLYGMIIITVIQQVVEMGFRSICCRITVGTVLETILLLDETLFIASCFPFHSAIRTSCATFHFFLLQFTLLSTFSGHFNF